MIFFTVAAFDFDNTLTDRDSFLPFLFFTHGFWKTIYQLFLLTPYFLAFLIGLSSRQQVKEMIITRFFKGMPMGQLEALGKKYADEKLDHYVKAEGLKKIRWHLALGHRCVLVSAAPDFYLKYWGERHGFESTLSSKLAVSPNGQVTGKLEGANCWGPEKKRRLLEYLGPIEYELYAYGDSRGDEELLSMADFSFYRSFGQIRKKRENDEH
jgi:phosphatidylglycerophosphatase C